jgi:hypothetical protein
MHRPLFSAAERAAWINADPCCNTRAGRESPWIVVSGAEPARLAVPMPLPGKELPSD